MLTHSARLAVRPQPANWIAISFRSSPTPRTRQRLLGTCVTKFDWHSKSAGCSQLDLPLRLFIDWIQAKVFPIELVQNGNQPRLKVSTIL